MFSMTAGELGVVEITVATGVILPLSGICDGDVANDLTLKDGSVVGEAEDPAPFLDSWQVPSSLTSVGQTRFRPDSCATADCSPCLRMVSNRTFSACHRFVGVAGLQQGGRPGLRTAAPLLLCAEGKLPGGVDLGMGWEPAEAPCCLWARLGGAEPWHVGGRSSSTI